MPPVSGVPEIPAAAQTTDGPDYLRLPLAWTPSRRFDHLQVYEYRLALGAGDVAILRLIADKGWALTISHAVGQPETDRGLFATPHDALMVLVAEFVAPADRLERMPAEGVPVTPPTASKQSA